MGVTGQIHHLQIEMQLLEEEWFVCRVISNEGGMRIIMCVLGQFANSSLGTCILERCVCVRVRVGMQTTIRAHITLW